MADNTQLNATTTAGDTIASDDVSGIKFQRVKLALGSDGVHEADVSSAFPMPVSLSGANFVLATQTGTWFVIATPTGSQQISGSVAATLSGTNFLIATINNSVGVSGSVAATLSGVNFIIATPTGSQQISGSVAATLSGTNFIIATVNNSVGISGNVGATQSGVWSVGINTGSQVAIASVNGNIGVSGSVAATLSGINFIVATLSTGTSTVGGTYDVSRRLINERGAVVAASDSFVNATASGNTEVVAAQGSGIIVRVLSGTVMSSADQLIKFQSATTDISPSYPVIARGGWHMAYNPHGHMQTRPNEALNINLGVGTQTACHVSWCTTN